MFKNKVSTIRGSALLVSLGVLALLAIMGTTFVTMTRMDSKLNVRYIDDSQGEMLAKGAMEYVKGILADDLDRSMKFQGTLGQAPIAEKYTNRDTSGPYTGWSVDCRAGYNTDDNVANTDENQYAPNVATTISLRTGVPASHDFWLVVPNLGSSNNYMNTFRSIWSTGLWPYCGDQTGSFYSSTGGDVTLVDFNGVKYQQWVVRPNWTTYNDTCSSFLLDGLGPSTYLQGPGFTGDRGLTDGRYWRTAIRVSLPESQFYDFNMHGNTEWADPTVGTIRINGTGNNATGGTVFPANPAGNMDTQGLRGRIAAKTACWGFGGSPNYQVDASSYNFPVTLGPQSSMKHLGLLGFRQYLVDAAPAIAQENSLPGYSTPNSTSNVAIVGAMVDLSASLGVYDAVCYSPLQISLREVLFDSYMIATGAWGAIVIDPAVTMFPKFCDTWADSVIHARYGAGKPTATSFVAAGMSTTLPKGDPRLRVGWRADGASYYVIPSPEAPEGNDSYFGPDEILERETPSMMLGANPQNFAKTDTVGSRLFNLAYSNTYNPEVISTTPGINGFPTFGNDTDRANYTRWHALLSRSKASVGARDTILRGRIWPTEAHVTYRGVNAAIGAYQVPASCQNKYGAWNSLSILKRVNLNIIGARNTNWAYNMAGNAPGPTYLNFPSTDIVNVKNRWINKQQYEQDRCYYMLKGALLWSNIAPYNTPAGAAKGACQLIAALTDMIDRDQDETVYTAPDNLATGYGTERFPVINEIGLQIAKGATTPTYFRVELFNPCEDIPWLPNKMEAIDLSRYKLRIKTLASPGGVDFALNTLKPMGKLATLLSFTTVGDPDNGGQTTCLKIGGGGALAGGSASPNRYLHVNLDPTSVPGLPDVRGGVIVELVKTLAADGRVVVVDRASKWTGAAGGGYLNLAKYNDGTDSTAAQFVGIYRRKDPLNAVTYNCSGSSTSTTEASVIHSEKSTLDVIGTLGRVNTYGAANFNDVTDATSYNYDVKITRDVKIPDTDLPSVGWIGEAFAQWTYSDPNQGPITEHQTAAQVGSSPSANKMDFLSKLDLFKPFGSTRNLGILDIFTCWDPSNDGVDNDGDGVADNDEEVVVFGQFDVNAGVELWSEIFGTRPRYDPGLLRFKLDTNYGPRSVAAELGVSGFYSPFAPDCLRGQVHYVDPGQESIHYVWGSHGPGPRETIGDMLRCDALSVYPGWTIGGPCTNDPVNAAGQRDPDVLCGQAGVDGDGDGKVDEVDERDATFCWYSNLLTTRNSVFTVEVISELTDPPYYQNPPDPTRAAYKVDPSKVYARKHLVAVLDRSRTLKVNHATGECDFTNPVKVLVQRWAQMNK